MEQKRMTDQEINETARLIMNDPELKQELRVVDPITYLLTMEEAEEC